MPKVQPTIHFSAGLVTSRDPSTLSTGELVTATGCEYRVGTNHVHKQPGRVSTSSALGAAVQKIQHVQYDTGTDKLVAVAGGDVFEGTPSATPAFGAAINLGLSTSDDDIPRFSTMQDRWIVVNGTDSNYIREPNAVNVSGWADGNWRPLGMIKPTETISATLITSAGSAQNPSSAGTGDYSSGINATDNDLTTWAQGAANGGDSTDSHQWTFGASADTSRILYVTFSGGATEDPLYSQLPEYKKDILSGGQTEEVRGNHKIEVTEDLSTGPTWTTIALRAGNFQAVSATYEIADGTDLSLDFAVRSTVTYTSGNGDYIARVHNIKVLSGGDNDPKTLDVGVQYLVTERYEDSDGVLLESSGTEVSASTGNNSGANVYGATVTLPTAQQNTFSTHWGIYRTLDTTTGGFPILYLVDTVPIASTSYIDPLTKGGGTDGTDLTLAGNELYDTMSILYPSGDQVSGIPTATPPPKANIAIPFQGSMTYASADVPRRLYYSLPAVITAAALERVPPIYFLDFETPQNDSITSLVTTNGGKSLLVYFQAYTMLVNYLPQATDPGVFDTRVREYVSNMRGASGRNAVAEFTLPHGQTLAAAVDALGLWITDGVSAIQEWSRDLDWSTDFSGVDLTQCELVNNPEMRRLELLFADSSGNRKEYHFFYGRFKQDGDGNQVPIITGPHPASRTTTAGIRTKHYSNVGGTWFGWSGDASATGDVFHERAQASDASLGYDTSGNVPFEVKSGDMYTMGLSGSLIVEFGFPKFEDTPSKDITAVGGFRRDGASVEVTKTKTYNTDKSKIYWHKYAHRHNITFQDISTTAMPALVAYQLQLRGLPGEGGDVP